MRVIEKTKELFNIEKGNIKAGLLKMVFAAPFWIIVFALFLAIFGISRALFLTGTRPDQYVAEQWQKDSETPFRHMSVYAGGARANGDGSPMTYTEPGQSIHYADIPIIREALQGTTDSGSPAANKKNPNSDGSPRGWEDCYSSTVNATLECLEVKDGQETVSNKTSAQLVAVGGNFAAFHPFRYMSGGFLPETPVDTYQIVINDVLAWKFYRSYDVVGNRIMINGQMFTIIGVVEEKSTKTAELAGEQDNRAFIYFAALGSVCGGAEENMSDIMSDVHFEADEMMSESDESAVSSPSTSDYAIQCYEALLPELVNGVAVSDFKNALPSYSMTNPQLYVTDNTGRFGILRVYDTTFPLGETEGKRVGYEFPYWERAAHLTEERLFYDYALTALGIVMLLIGAITAVLKLRVRKTEAADEIDASDTGELDESGENELLLKA